MSQTIKLKRSAVAGRIPSVNDLDLGEVAINTTDGKMYIKKSVGGTESVVEISGGGSQGFTAFTTYTYTATENQTVFSGADANSNSLDIVDEFSNVFLNGILLDPDTDFTIAVDGLSVTLTSPALAGDLLQINTYDQAIFNGTLSVNALELDGSAGLITWNGTEETVDIPLNNDVTLQVGQEQVFRGKATEAISNGDVVMFAGAQGDHLLIAKADMSVVGFRPEYVIGLATQDFAANDFGFVTSQGKVHDLDTATCWSEGDILYLDPTTAGAWTTTVPTPPNHIIQVAAVTRSHANQGTVLVRVTHFSDTDEVPEGSTNLYFTDARAVSAIQGDASWNATDWDTAYGWGDHSTENYLTTVAFSDLTGKPTTIADYGITDAFDGAYSSLTGAPTTVSSFTNDSGYITDYTVTQGDVTAHQGALSITESQISDFGTYLTSETTTSLSASGNILTYTDEDGNSNTIDLSLYIDDTNAARITSGTMNSSGIATFTRDDATTFTVDMSVLLDDTNLARITSAAWNTSNGVLTLTRNDASTITVDLDDRYLTSHQDISGKANKAGDTFTGKVTLDNSTGWAGNNDGSNQFVIDAGDGYPTATFATNGTPNWSIYKGGIGSWVGEDSIGFVTHSGTEDSSRVKFKIDTSGNITALGTITASGYNKSNWDTAYTYSQVGHLPLTGGTVNGVVTLSSANDNQLNLQGVDTWAGISFKDVNNAQKEFIWFNGVHETFAIGGGGSSVSGKKLHVDGGVTIGSSYGNVPMPTNGLYVQGDIKTDRNLYLTNNATDSHLGLVSANGAYQRADSRDDGVFARTHWYGVSDTGGTSNFRHAWYDGNSYVDVTAENDGVTFGGHLTATNVIVNGDLKMSGADSYIWTPNTSTGFTGIWDPYNNRSVLRYDNNLDSIYLQRFTNIGNAASTNTGSWNARLNVTGSQHARLDVVSDSDDIITTMYSHTGQDRGFVGTSSAHKLGLASNGTVRWYIETDGKLRHNDVSAVGMGDGGIRSKGAIDSGDASIGAFRVYDGSTFRGGFGTARWGIGGGYAEDDMCMYSVGDKAFIAINNGTVGLQLTSSGISAEVGGFLINGSTVIDSNKTFIGNEGYFSGDVHVNSGSSGSDYLRLHKTASGDGGILFVTDNSLNWQNVQSSTGLNWYSYSDGSTVASIKNDGTFTAKRGYQVNGSTVIDSSKNLFAKRPIFDSESSNDGALVSRWRYADSVAYMLELHQRVTSGVVRWSFGQVNASTTYSDLFVLDRGRVGFGIQNPEKQVHIYGSGNEPLYLQGTGGGVWMNIKSNTSLLWSMGADSNGWAIYDRTNSAYRLRVKSTGVLDIPSVTSGTIISTGFATDAIGYNPTYGVYIGGTSGSYLYTGTGTCPRYWNGSAHDVWTTSQYEASSTGGANKIARYHSSGYLFVENWIHQANGTGLYYSSGTHFNEDNSNGRMRLHGGSTSDAVLRFSNATTGTLGYVYASNAKEIGFANSAESWSLKLTDAKEAVFYGNISTNSTGAITSLGYNLKLRNSGSNGGALDLISANGSLSHGDVRDFGSHCMIHKYTYSTGGTYGQYAENWWDGDSYHRIQIVNGVFEFGGSISATGNVTAYSDIKLKTNIKTIDNALEKVNTLRGVTYDRIDLQNENHTGVIAQEVEKVLPQAVHTDNDGIKSVAYGNMVGLLIEAIKELKQEIEELKNGNN